jgi:hypothetical protein
VRAGKPLASPHLGTRNRLNPPGTGNRLERKRCRRSRSYRTFSTFNGVDYADTGVYLLNTSGRTIRKGEMVMLTSLGTVDVIAAPPATLPPAWSVTCPP